MSAFARLRRWINRDDGQLYRVGNRPLGIIEVVGWLLVIAAILLWQVHTQFGASAVWSYAFGVVGLLLAFVGELGGGGDSRA